MESNKQAILDLLARCCEEAGEKVLFRCFADREICSSQDAEKVAEALVGVEGEADIRCWSTLTWEPLGWVSILPQEEATVVAFHCNEFCSAVCGIPTKHISNLISACDDELPGVEFELYADNSLLCPRTDWKGAVKNLIVAHRNSRNLVLECYNPRGGHYLGSFYLEPTEAELVSKRTHGNAEGREFIEDAFATFKFRN